MTKKLTYQGEFNSQLLADELQEAFPDWGGVTSEGTTRMESKPDGTEVYLFVPDNADEWEIQAVVDLHDHTKEQKKPVQEKNDDLLIRITQLEDRESRVIELRQELRERIATLEDAMIVLPEEKDIPWYKRLLESIK